MTSQLSAISYQLSVNATSIECAIKPSPSEGEGWERVRRNGSGIAVGRNPRAGRGLTPPAPTALWPLGLTSDEVGPIAYKRTTELRKARAGYAAFRGGIVSHEIHSRRQVTQRW